MSTPATVSMPEALAVLASAVLKLEQAIRLLEHAARDDRETIGELAGAVNRHDDELAELRDELCSLAARTLPLPAGFHTPHDERPT